MKARILMKGRDHLPPTEMKRSGDRGEQLQKPVSRILRTLRKILIKLRNYWWSFNVNWTSSVPWLTFSGRRTL
jgi:hypothetical protein